MQNKTKIVEVIADSSLGGGTKHVLGLLKAIDKQFFDPLLICPSGWLSKEAKKIAGTTVENIPFQGKFDLESRAKLKTKIGEFRSSYNPFGPIIIHAHGPRAGFFALKTLKPDETLVYTEHIWTDEYQLKNPINTWLQLKGLRKILNRAQKIIAVSSPVAKFLGQFVDKKKIEIIPNAIDFNPPAGRRQKDEMIVGSVGSLNFAKGQKYLIQAFSTISKKFPEARLEIVGDGPLKEQLKEQAESLGLSDKIKFLGQKEDIKSIIENWSVFALPSVSETFGIAILEAFSLMIPVVASRVGGVVDIIKNDENGILVPAKNSQALATEIIDILDNDRKAARLAVSALSTLKNRFTWDKIITEIEKVYFDVGK